MEARTKYIIAWLSVFAAAFALSLIFFLTNDSRKEQRVLFFPNETTSEWSGEVRNITHRRVPEDAVHELLKEIILGPMRLRLERAVPEDTAIRSVILRENVLFADFSAHLAVGGGGVTVGFESILEGIKKNILFNFPSISEVHLFVEGYSAGA